MTILNEHSYEIFYDAFQEGVWFKSLSNCFSDAKLIQIPKSLLDQQKYNINCILQYDKPDIILKDNGKIILVLERTKEVPSGHNVGQRFGRIVAAAKERIPVVYFGPYMAYKHGGSTAGPRYMNLRLFYSLKNLADCYNTAVTTINWPVDKDCELLKTPDKDTRLIEYIKFYMNYYNMHGSDGLTEYIKRSSFQDEQYEEQKEFIKKEVQSPEQYETPPPSVEIIPISKFEMEYCVLPKNDNNIQSIELYHIGMENIRSDPYTGMAALYNYLYCRNGVVQILHFLNIQSSKWHSLRKTTKTYRMYKEFSYAILFKDQLLMNVEL